MGGRCIAPNAETLSGSELAVDGVVQEVTDTDVRLSVTSTYAGPSVTEVVVEAPAEELVLLLSAVDFQEGMRYLVAANDGQVMVCGFSGAYSEQLAELYDDAFPGPGPQ